jgi:hypothetical protein
MGSVSGQTETPRNTVPAFHDELLDHLVGKWDLTATVTGGTTPLEGSFHFTFEVDWVLNHQFLRIHEKSKEIPSWSNAHEALIFIGFDDASKRYYAHLMAPHGRPRVGYGDRNGNEITIGFPNVPGRTEPGMQELHRFIWQPESRTWNVSWGASRVTTRPAKQSPIGFAATQSWLSAVLAETYRPRRRFTFAHPNYSRKIGTRC